MALICVENVEVLENPALFTADFQFKITFECLAPGIEEELDWKLVYIGSADDEEYDQELESVLVGPVSIGKNQFIFTAPAPDPSRIPRKDLVDVTALLLTCSYRGNEFIRVGYYVNTYLEGQAPVPQQFQTPQEQPQVSIDDEDDDDMEDAETPVVTAPDEPIDISKLYRNILAQPRVTRYTIQWDNDPSQAVAMEDDTSMSLDTPNSTAIES